MLYSSVAQKKVMVRVLKTQPTSRQLISKLLPFPGCGTRFSFVVIILKLLRYYYNRSLLAHLS